MKYYRIDCNSSLYEDIMNNKIACGAKPYNVMNPRSKSLARKVIAWSDFKSILIMNDLDENEILLFIERGALCTQQSSKEITTYSSYFNP